MCGIYLRPPPSRTARFPAPSPLGVAVGDAHAHALTPALRPGLLHWVASTCLSLLIGTPFPACKVSVCGGFAPVVSNFRHFDEKTWKTRVKLFCERNKIDICLRWRLFLPISTPFWLSDRRHRRKFSLPPVRSVLRPGQSTLHRRLRPVSERRLPGLSADRSTPGRSCTAL